MTDLDVYDRIDELNAMATVNGIDAVQEIVRDCNADLPRYVVTLIEKGLAQFKAERAKTEKFRLKVLEIEPTFYQEEEMRQASMADWKGRWALERKDEREKEKARRLEFERKAREAMEFYERWKLPDGTPLGDATREQLRKETAKERNIADGHLKTASFYCRLSEYLQDGERVRDVIPLSRAHEIRAEVWFREVAA